MTDLHAPTPARSAPAGARPPWPRPGRLWWRQVRHQNRMFWRSPVASVFTLAFPVLFLVLFNLLFDDTVDVGQGEVAIAQFYTPALAVFTAVSAAYTGLIMQTALAREQGVLKRVRGTPLPPGLYLGGVVGSAVWIAALGTVGMLVLGWAVYDFTIDAVRLPTAVLVFVVGVATFAALGLAVSGLAADGRSASALANFTLLPMAFLSGVFVPLEDPPTWLTVIGDVLPLKPFVVAFDAAFNPNVDPPGLQWDRLAVMAAWFVVGVLGAVRLFRWEPAVSTRRGNRRSRRGAAPAEEASGDGPTPTGSSR